METNRVLLGSWEKIKNGILEAVDDVFDKRKLVPRITYVTIVLIEGSIKINYHIGYKIIENEITEKKNGQ